MAEPVLLNVCCAPCGLPLLNIFPETVLYFYGPNIFPEQEYQKRLAETRKVAAIYGLKLIEGEHDHASWLDFVKSKLERPPETYAENEARCQACFHYRLEQTAKFAAKNGFSRFAATLSVSRFKDTALINKLGDDCAKEFGLEYVTFPVDAHESHRRGLELSRQHNIYRQKYCGCEFSLG